MDLRNKDKEVRERKVVVRHGRGVQGEPAECLGGAWGTKVDSQPSETVPGGATKTRSECRTGIGGGGAHMVPSLGEGAGGRGGIWGTLPRSLVRWGGV